MTRTCSGRAVRPSVLASATSIGRSTNVRAWRTSLISSVMNETNNLRAICSVFATYTHTVIEVSACRLLVAVACPHELVYPNDRMTDEEFQEAVLERFDSLIALLTLAHGHAIKQTRDELRSDPLNAAVLDASADDWVQAGALIETVKAQTGRSSATIRRRIAELAASNALRSRGATSNRAYRSRGIV